MFFGWAKLGFMNFFKFIDTYGPMARWPFLANLKKFMKPSFAQPKNISEDQTSNPKKKNLNQATIHI